jgi:uncharacterized protein YbjT (DUF2867 family)
VIQELLAQGHEVRALVRRPEKAKALSEAGADIAVGDLEKPETLEAAFAGIEKAFILTPPSDRAPAQFSNALWAAKQAGGRSVTRLSAFGAGHDAPTINGRHHALSDSELMDSELAWTIIRPHFFMQNLMMAADGVKEKGKLYFALGEGRMGVIDTRDIGHFITRILTTQGHEGKIYTLTGPESVSMHDVAADLSSVLGREIRYQPVVTGLALSELKSKGADEYTLNILHDYFVEYSRNWGDVVTDDFKNVTGTEPRTLKTFISDHAEAFGA